MGQGFYYMKIPNFPNRLSSFNFITFYYISYLLVFCLYYYKPSTVDIDKVMYKKILVPIDGSKLADKALDHVINLVKSISSSSDHNNRIELTILHVIPDLPVPLGFEKPMRSFKTGEVISFSEYVKEMQESMRLTAVEMLSERAKKYEMD